MSRGTNREPEGDREFVRSLARGLQVIQVFGREAPSLTLSEVARRAGTSRGAARRFLHTLHVLGFVEVENDRFRLTARTLSLGYAYLSSLPLRQLAAPIVERLSLDLDETCSIAVLDWTDVVYVVRARTRRILADTLSVGSRVPAFGSSLGKCLLAGLDDDELDRRLASISIERRTRTTVRDRAMLKAEILATRAHGFALNREELELGLCSIGVPIRNHREQTIAAMNISCHSARVPPAELQARFLKALLRAAAEIERLATEST